jgi:hypothetical protein
MNGKILTLLRVLIVYRPGFARRTVLFLSDVVSRLVNHCISTNVFQSYLKLARVVLVLNSKSQLVLNNYRPNSILNISSKIFEQVLHIGLQKYLDAHSMIIDQNGNQYGIVHSSNALLVTTSLMSFARNMREKLDAGLFVVGLDLRKAFDCVDHNLLLSKMFREGIRDDPLSLFRSYLEQREQMLQINGQ